MKAKCVFAGTDKISKNQVLSIVICCDALIEQSPKRLTLKNSKTVSTEKSYGDRSIPEAPMSERRL